MFDGLVRKPKHVIKKPSLYSFPFIDSHSKECIEKKRCVRAHRGTK
jgi:hypothetical protein